MRNRAERALCMLLKECKSLEELEIGPDFSETPDALIRYVGPNDELLYTDKHIDLILWELFFYRNLRETFLTADSLCGLTLNTNLKKFSLNSVKISYKQEEINDTSLLEEVTSLSFD
jgi:hypothetical protein